MTPLQAMILATPLSDWAAQMELDIMLFISSKLAEDASISSTEKWKIRKLGQLGSLNKGIVKIIASQTGKAAPLLEAALHDAAQSTISTYEPSFKKLVKDGYIKGTRIQPERAISQAVKMYRKQARKSLNMVNTVMRYKAKEAYKRVVKDTAELANKQDFLDILNRTTGEAITGVTARQEAMRKTIKEFNARGIPAFVDTAGREWSPEAYVNMDIRTTVNNVAHQTQFERMDDYGIDLIQVSSHAGSRPKCAKDQGRIWDKSNKSRDYPHWKNSSYGEPDGILGVNCGHWVYPYIKGVSIQRYFPAEDPEKDAELYRAKQKQREIERQIKAAKRECAMFDTLGDKDQFKKSSLKLKNRQNKLKDHLNQTGLTRKRGREQVTEFDRAVSSKATAASRKGVNRMID